MDTPLDWDLLAVVRSCCSTTTTADLEPSPSIPLPPPSSSSSQFTLPPKLPQQQQQQQPPKKTTTSSAYLASPVSSPSSVITRRSFGIIEQQQHQQQTQLRGLIKLSHVIFGTSSPSIAGNNASQTPRTKKRNNLMKKVCHVPAEGLSSNRVSLNSRCQA
ncbi:probable WRKY transcription factor 27 [Chenopodium quinoa]|uniref:probable WRKY transcription factor 27 n=1 Tax=Chenopodium quinoa TaxID=63459 RepID=UPI000B77C48A|nr:probable WRKY transcription factor 27 [Chenopodium quinoa]